MRMSEKCRNNNNNNSDNPLTSRRADGGKNRHTRPDFLLRSSRIRADLLSYESKPTDKQEQYDWTDEKKLGGHSEAVGPGFFATTWTGTMCRPASSPSLAACWR